MTKKDLLEAIEDVPKTLMGGKSMNIEKIECQTDIERNRIIYHCLKRVQDKISGPFIGIGGVLRKELSLEFSEVKTRKDLHEFIPELNTTISRTMWSLAWPLRKRMLEYEVKYILRHTAIAMLINIYGRALSLAEDEQILER